MAEAVLWLLSLLSLPSIRAYHLGTQHAGHRSTKSLGISLALPAPSACTEARDSLLQVWETAGLSESEALEVYAKRPTGKLPAVAAQARLVKWLQADVLRGVERPGRLTYFALAGAPKLLAFAGRRLPQLQDSLDALRLLLAELSPSQFANAVAHTPLLLITEANELDARSRWLGSRLNITEDELGAGLAAAPRLLATPRTKLEQSLSWFSDRLEISDGRIRRVFSEAPLSLLLAPSTMEARLALLDSMGLSDQLIATLVVRTPRLLHTPLPELCRKLDALIEELELPADGLEEWFSKQPDALGVSGSRITALRKWLAEIGLPDSSHTRILRDHPKILTMRQDELRLRASFFLSVLNGSPDELTQVPHVLTADIGRHIMLRHAFCVSRGLSVRPTEMLVKDTAEFCMEVVGCNKEELRAFEREGMHLQFYQGAAL